jgi:4-hydroxy 2-oxovalerate aldolase
MVSGANSLPQKQVMEWVGKRYYSFNSIIRALHNQSQGKEDNISLPKLFIEEKKYSKALLVGGGSTAVKHSEAIDTFLAQKPDILVVHASSKNALSFINIPNDQLFCLVGNEGHRLEKVFGNREIKGKCILPPYPRTMGTYVPKAVYKNACELEKVDFTDKYQDSHTAIALQTIIDLKILDVLIVGYDGYSGIIEEKEQELFLENEFMFEKAANHMNLSAITETNYKTINKQSVYSLINE